MTGPACRVCGRPLRSAGSVARGVGPVCDQFERGAPPPRPRARHPPTGEQPIPGQTSIPIQPILWST